MITAINNKKNGLTGTDLKIIASLTMFIDHFAYGIIYRWLLAAGYNSYDTVVEMEQWMSGYGIYLYIYKGLRLVGRLAFPLFCFMIVEGVYHSSDRKKYALRLLLFALISEVPFDLCMRHTVCDMSRQNVFVTLLLGMLMIWCFVAQEKLFVDKGYNAGLNIVLQPVICAIFSYAAYFVKCDYGLYGVLTVASMYWVGKIDKRAEGLPGAVVLIYHNLLEISTIIDIPLIGMYNGKKGLNIKYFFYIFYPAHLLLIYICARVFGL